MPIHALCLVQRATGSTPVSTDRALHIEALDDAWLVHTPFDFASEPQVLYAQLNALAGAGLFEHHRDPRGLFFLPHIAAPHARTYAGVLEEVGEGGVWASPRDLEPTATAPAELESLLGGVLAQMPPGLFEAVASSIDPAALAQVRARLDAPDAQSGTASPLDSLLAESGIDFSSPLLQQAMAALQSELARDPQRLAQLAEQLFAGEGEKGEGADSEDDTED